MWRHMPRHVSFVVHISYRYHPESLELLKLGAFCPPSIPQFRGARLLTVDTLSPL
jgi:hypothetical protein